MALAAAAARCRYVVSIFGQKPSAGSSPDDVCRKLHLKRPITVNQRPLFGQVCIHGNLITVLTEARCFIAKLVRAKCD